MLTAHGQWPVGSDPIRVVGGVRKGSRIYLILCSTTMQFQAGPDRKKANISKETLKDVSYFIKCIYNNDTKTG